MSSGRVSIGKRNSPVPSDMWVATSPWAVHQNPEYWSQPQEFKPSRWLISLEDVQTQPYIPFGGETIKQYRKYYTKPIHIQFKNVSATFFSKLMLFFDIVQSGICQISKHNFSRNYGHV